MELSMKKQEQDLNHLYKTDFSKYLQRLNEIKNMGFKVYRNSKGDHQIKENPNFIYEVYDGIFGKIFNNPRG